MFVFKIVAILKIKWYNKLRKFYRGRKVKKTTKEKVFTFTILIFLILTLIFDVFNFSILKNQKDNYYLSNILTLICGSIAVALLMIKEKTGLFKTPKNLSFLLLGLVIALDNFQFASFFAGKMQPINAEILTWILFFISCMLTGFFEEGLFRGVVFSVLASRLEKNKTGLLKTIIISSLIFGGAHLLNIFSGASVGATLLQACYSTLTGALFAFILVKTKNIILCALTHGLYNFCGLLFSAEQGLGAGVVFDIPTALTMFIISLIVFVVSIIAFIKYTEEERIELYGRLGFGVEEKN